MNEVYPPELAPNVKADLVDTASNLPYLVMLRHMQPDAGFHNQDVEVQQRIWHEESVNKGSSAVTSSARRQFYEVVPSRMKSVAERSQAVQGGDTVITYGLTG